jgi:hypothetical protein
MSLLLAVLAETEAPAPLIFPPLVFGGIALAVFITLALVSWSFRDVANRHAKPTANNKSHGAGH